MGLLSGSPSSLVGLYLNRSLGIRPLPQSSGINLTGWEGGDHRGRSAQFPPHLPIPSRSAGGIAGQV